MKRPGPPPAPPGLKVLHGNPGHRPIKPASLKPLAGARCPKGLSPSAKAEWQRLAPELGRLGILTRLDRAAFAGYCEAWSKFDWAVKELERHGLVSVSKNGIETPSPAFHIMAQS